MIISGWKIVVLVVVVVVVGIFFLFVTADNPRNTVNAGCIGRENKRR